MMWDSGLRAMRNNKLFACLLVSSIIFGATALAQVEPEPPSTPSESPGTTEPSDTAIDSEANSEPNASGDSTDLEQAATAPTDPPKSEPDLLVQGDDYRPSERVSEDRSVSFPVDI